VAATITIDGTAFAEAARGGSRFRLDTLEWDLDSGYSLAFHEFGGAMAPRFGAEKSVSLAVGGVTYFTGVIVSTHPTFTTKGWTHAYRAKGLEWLAEQVAFTAGDGTGSMTWNRTTDDPLYNASLAGKSVGDILKAALDLHAVPLAAAGITSYVPAELTALTIVPPDPVTLSGERLWNTLRSFASEWCRNHALWVLPDGTVRMLDTRAFAGLTLTLHTDPVDNPSWTRSTEDCATRLVIRGGANVQPAHVSKVDGTFTEGFSSGDKTAWSWSKYARPGDSASEGSCTVPSSTTVVVTATDPSRTWAANFWPGVAGHCNTINPAATGIDMFEDRSIVSNTALSAGGTSTLTLDRPLSYNAATKYRLTGTQGSDTKTWRRYNFPSNLAGKLVPRSPVAYPLASSSGAVALTNFPAFMIAWSSTGADPNKFVIPKQAEIDVPNNCAWFVEPTCKAFCTNQADLDTGGFTARTASNGVPDDVRAMVFYSIGALTVSAPASGFEGTAYTADNIQRTRYVDVPSWVYAGGVGNLGLLAQMLLDSMKDTVYSGSITYHGTLASALVPGSKLNVAAPSGAAWASPLAAMDAPVRGLTLDWTGDGDGPTTTLQFSTRRQPATGDRLYIPPAFLAEGHSPGGGS
jgi:hypothetical protein